MKNQILRIARILFLVTGLIIFGCSKFKISIPNQTPTSQNSSGGNSGSNSFTVTLQNSYSTVVDSPLTFNPQVGLIGSRTIVNYTWDFDDGTSNLVTTNPSIAHTFTHTGNFSISVTVKLSDNATSTANSTVTVDDPSNDPLNKPLLTQANFATTATHGYQGLFKYPLVAGSWSTAFSHGGLAFRYESDGIKFFSLAHVYSGGLAYMINFPGFVKTSIASAPSATIVKNLGDIYNGHKCFDNDGGSCDIGAGVATYGLYYEPSSSKLYWNYGHWYNATDPQNPSFGYSIVTGTGVNTVATGQAAYRFQGRGEKFTRGGVTPIPTWFANRFTGGRNLAAGFGGYFSIISSGSLGAALTAVFSPDISVNPDKSYLQHTPLLGYPTPHHQERDPNYNSAYYSGGGGWDPPGAWNPLNGKGFYTWSDTLYQGCTWIDRAGSQGIVCIIQVCQGNAYYQASNLHCDSGTGAYEWFVFDPKDLARVANGEIQQHQVQPVSYWTDPNLPLVSYQANGWDGSGFGVSITYDPLSDQLFVLSTSENHQGVEWYPVMRGWKLSGN